jgi:hypothetical protein
MPGKEPPAEALAACKGKNDGDECEFKAGDREMKGECKKPPAGAEKTDLACMPAPPPSPPSEKR